MPCVVNPLHCPRSLVPAWWNCFCPAHPCFSPDLRPPPTPPHLTTTTCPLPPPTPLFSPPPSHTQPPHLTTTMPPSRRAWTGPAPPSSCCSVPPPPSSAAGELRLAAPPSPLPPDLPAASPQLLHRQQSQSPRGATTPAIVHLVHLVHQLLYWKQHPACWRPLAACQWHAYQTCWRPLAASGVLAQRPCHRIPSPPPTRHRYLLHKHWLANNALGLAFSLQGIEHLSLGAIQNGVILLCGEGWWWRCGGRRGRGSGGLQGRLR